MTLRAVEEKPKTDLAVGCGEGAPWGVSVVGVAGGEVHRLRVERGGVATSGIHARLWRRADGTYAHHLLDPATGDPAWTGLVAATAVAPTALEAEVLAKTAVLCGPRGARRVLAAGGVLHHEDGSVEIVEPRRVVTLPRVALRASGVAASATAMSSRTAGGWPVDRRGSWRTSCSAPRS